MKFEVLNADGSGRARLFVFQNYGRSYALQPIWPDPARKDASAEDWVALYRQALERLRADGMAEAGTRVSDIPEFAAFRERLPELGFRRRHVRVEYRAELEKLPTDEGSPFTWESMAPAGPWDEARVVELLRKVGRGDPDFDVENEDVLEVLRGYFNDPELTNDPAHAQVGRLEGKSIAFVFAQVAPKSGWSRITYMGLAPEWRGRGLGKWVHRRGFELMRRQGGKLYHGGTLEQNAGMRALFLSHGCAEFRRLEEWVCAL